VERRIVPYRLTGLVAVMNFEILRAFYDESGIHRGDVKFCALNGFIARSDEWQQFDQTWRKTLQLAGEKAFHAKKFFRRRRLSPRRRECLRGLLKAASDSNLLPRGAIVDIREFQARSYLERCYLAGALVDADNTENLERFADPYYLAFHHCLAEAARIAKPGEKVQFVFAEQLTFCERAHVIFKEVKKRLSPEVREKIGGCSFEKMEDVGPPFEIADMLAHCWYSHMQYGTSNSPDREHALNSLMVEKDWIYRYGEKEFEMLLNQRSPDERALLRGGAGPVID